MLPRVPLLGMNDLTVNKSTIGQVSLIKLSDWWIGGSPGTQIAPPEIKGTSNYLHCYACK